MSDFSFEKENVKKVLVPNNRVLRHLFNLRHGIDDAFIWGLSCDDNLEPKFIKEATLTKRPVGDDYRCVGDCKIWLTMPPVLRIVRMMTDADYHQIFQLSENPLRTISDKRFLAHIDLLKISANDALQIAHSLADFEAFRRLVMSDNFVNDAPVKVFLFLAGHQKKRALRIGRLAQACEIIDAVNGRSAGALLATVGDLNFVQKLAKAAK